MRHDDDDDADDLHDSTSDAARAPEHADTPASDADVELDEPERLDVPKPKRKPPAAGSGIAPPPAHVVQIRVATVARALVDGLGRAAVMQAVAVSQAKEAAARAKARAAGAADAIELNGLVPYVWGDVPMPERTVDAYIHRAKALLADEGKRVSRQREYVLAIQLARLNETYRAAFSVGRYHTCLGVIREVNQMFGMHEAIKVLLLNEARAQSDSERSKSDDLSTEHGKMAALSIVIQKASAKDPALGSIFARFAALNTSPQPPASTNGGSSTSSTTKRKSSGSNGSNGAHT